MAPKEVLHRPTLKPRDGPGSALVESTLAGGTLLALLLGVNNLFMGREVSVAAGWLPSGPRTGPSLRPDGSMTASKNACISTR